MNPLSRTRTPQIGYHIAEAEAWLAASEAGKQTTLLAYAALELRLEAERVALELLIHVGRDRMSSDTILEVARSFRHAGEKIYELEGHQRMIDRKVAFSNILTQAINAPHLVQAVNVGRLRAIWHGCSELCHIMWSFAAEAPDSGANAFSELSGFAGELRSIVDAGISWMSPGEGAVLELRDAFVRGTIGEAEVRAWIERVGLWGSIVGPDGRMNAVLGAVPPTDTSGDAA